MRAQQRLDGGPGAACRDEVEIPDRAHEARVDALAQQQPDAHPAEQPQRQPAGGGRGEQSLRLVGQRVADALSR